MRVAKSNILELQHWRRKLAHFREEEPHLRRSVRNLLELSLRCAMQEEGANARQCFMAGFIWRRLSHVRNLEIQVRLPADTAETTSVLLIMYCCMQIHARI